jgi:hypothetical protein
VNPKGFFLLFIEYQRRIFIEVGVFFKGENVMYNSRMNDNQRDSY